MSAPPPSGLRAWALALLASLVLWNLPFGGVLLYPFKLLGTWLHELSHATAMTLTGVGASGMIIYPDTSGMAYAAGAADGVARPVIAAAGYMGTPLVGGALLVLCKTALRARVLLLALAAALAATALCMMPAAFGQRAIAAIAVAALVAAWLLPARWRIAAVQLLAAQACVNALLDLRVLFRPVLVVGGRAATASDAHTMAAATFGTSERWAVWTWACLWLLWSLAVCFVAVRAAARGAVKLEPMAQRGGEA